MADKLEKPQQHLEDASRKLDMLGPVFVMGCPRSGTTFLLNCLAQLPQIYVASGVLAPPILMHVIGSDDLPAEAKEHLLWSIRTSLWQHTVQRHLSRGEAVLDALRGRQPWRLALGRKHRPIEEFRMVYKEPFAVYAAPQLADHFEKAKFIHIVRDGRDCADSLRRTYPLALSDQILQDPVLCRENGSEVGVARRWREWSIPWWLTEGEEEWFTGLSQFGRCVALWKDMVTRGRSLSNQLEESRCLEVRYEELCREPRRVGAQVLAFIGTTDSRRYWREMSRARESSIGIHRSGPAELVREAASVGAPLLEELGYSVETRDAGQ